MNEKEALLLGIILGDGCIGVYNNKRQHKTVVTGHSVDDKEFLFNVVKPLLEDVFKKHVVVRARTLCRATDVSLYSKEVFNTINKEWEVQSGKKKEIFISNNFLDNQNLMKKIVSGFFATDGSLVITNNNGTWYSRVEFVNTSSTILKQIQDFLLVLGIKGGLYKMKRNKPTSFGGKCYRLQYNGKENLLKFRKEIGFINPKHKNKFEEFALEMLV